MRSSRINVITFTVFMAALSTIFFFVPAAGVFFAPLPLALSYYRYGLQTALTTTALAMLVNFLLGGPQRGLAYLLTAALLGLAFGYALKAKLRPAVTGAALTVVGAIGNAGAIAVICYVSSLNLPGFIRQLVEATLPDPAKFGTHSAQINQAYYSVIPRATQLDNRISLISLLWPALLVVGAVVGVFLLYTAARWTLPRLGAEVPPFTPFAEWQLPRQLSWVTLLAMLAVLPAWLRHTDLGPLGRVGVNLLFVVGALYLVQGYSVAYFWLRRYLPKGFAATLPALVILFLKDPAALALCVVGMWDGAINLRKLQLQPPADEASADKQPPED